MRIFLVAYFVEPPQDLVPYAQRVVCVMGAAVLVVVYSMPHKQCNSWRRQGAQCCQIGDGEVSYQRLKMVVFGG